MFKLKVPKKRRETIKSTLRVPEAVDYDYVLTTDKDLVEKDKINIVFDEEHVDEINKLLDLIAKGQDVFVTGYNEVGQKNIESRYIHYFVIEDDDVQAVLKSTRFIVKMKLYEIEELLENKHFIRVSKYALVNINKIDYIKPALNSKLILLMRNGDEVEVNRHYYKAFKKALNL